MSIAGKTLGELCSGTLRPPLVSFVVICWNYARYVAETLASIKVQDYPHFECLVIDNGSTDRSGEEIKITIGDDKRFSIVTFEENRGQLGAAVWALDHINGSFVTFVDADDLLFPTFASTHVQVHLSLPRSVAMTSSNVVETNAEGGVITSRYNYFGLGDEDKTDLEPPSIVPRLSTIPADRYELLMTKTVTRPYYKHGWAWAPGTANMLRRSILNQCRLNDPSRKRMRAADTHFSNLCHAIGSSALIDLPLSTYRLHQTNYFSTSESLPGIRQGTREYSQRDAVNRNETLECVLENVDRFSWMLPERYWLVVDHLESMGNIPPPYADDPQSAEIFTRHISKICKEFGHKRSVREITRRFGLDGARAIFVDGLSPLEYRSTRTYFWRIKLKKILSSLTKPRRSRRKK